MMVSRIKTSRIRNKRNSNSNRLTDIQKSRIKKQYSEIDKKLGGVSSKSQQFAENLNRLQTQTYFPQYEFNVDSESYELKKEGTTTPTGNDPMTLLRHNTPEFLRKYGAGEYDDYFKNNPTEQDDVEQFLTTKYIPEKNKQIQAKLDLIKRNNLIIARQRGTQVSLAEAQSGVSKLQAESFAFGTGYSNFFNESSEAERGFVNTENTKLSTARNEFNTALSGLQTVGGYEERLSAFNQLTTAQRSNIELSQKNIDKYNLTYDKLKKTSNYVNQYLDNPNYVSIFNNGSLTKVSKKSEKYKSGSSWSKGGRTQYDYSSYSPHELLFSNGKLVKETYKTVDLTDTQKDRNWKDRAYSVRDTKVLTYGDGSLKKKQEFGLFRSKYHRGSGWYHKAYKTYESGFMDYELGQGYTKSAPRGSSSISYTPTTTITKPTTTTKKKYTITASNLFGTSNNKLRVGEKEISKINTVTFQNRATNNNKQSIFNVSTPQRINKQTSNNNFMGGLVSNKKKTSKFNWG